MDNRRRLIRLANESRKRGDLSGWGRYLSAVRWEREDAISDLTAFRYCKALGYTDRGSLKEVRIWVYESQDGAYSDAALSDALDNFLDSLDRVSSNHNLRAELWAHEYASEIGVEVSRNEMGISGHRPGVFYGYFKFKMGGSPPVIFRKVSTNGRFWRTATAPFSLKRPGKISRRELQRAVERRVFPKPKKLKMVKPELLTAIESQTFKQLGKLAAKHKKTGDDRAWAVTMNRIRWGKVKK